VLLFAGYPTMSKPDANILRLFFRLTFVNVLSNLMVPLAGLIDTAFLGHLHEIRHLAGVALASVLFNYLYWTFGFLRMGTTGLTAQAMGRQDLDGALLVGLRNGTVALGLGLTILLLQQPLGLIGFALLSAAPEVKAAGQSYFDALIWGAPATLLNFVIIGWYLGRSQSGKVLLLSAVGNLTNVGLDALFIGRWGWQSAGAGGATAISQGLMLGVGLGLIRRDVSGSQISQVLKQLWNFAAFRAAMTLNQDILVRTFALISTFAIFTNLSASLGTAVLSANTLLLQVVTLSAYFIDGLAFATESLVGTLSTQNPILLRRLLGVAGITSLGIGLSTAAAFALAPEALLQPLTDHRDILRVAARYVNWLLPVLGFGSVSYLLDGYFLGLTAGKLLKKSTILAALFGFFPAAMAAWFFRNVDLLWLALALFMAGRAITLGVQVPKTLLAADPAS
jgi:multidrug resistance protein, MATE family